MLSFGMLDVAPHTLLHEARGMRSRSSHADHAMDDMIRRGSRGRQKGCCQVCVSLQVPTRGLPPEAFAVVATLHCPAHRSRNEPAGPPERIVEGGGAVVAVWSGEWSRASGEGLNFCLVPRRRCPARGVCRSVLVETRSVGLLDRRAARRAKLHCHSSERRVNI